MLGNKRPLPSPERGAGELSRPRKRWRTLLLAMREELCLRESLGRIHFETGSVCFRRLLQVQLVSTVTRVVSEEMKKALSFLHAPPRVIPGGENNQRIQLKFLDKVSQPVHTSFKVERQNSQQGDTGLRIAIYLNNKKITQGPLASAKIEALALRGDFCKNVSDNWSKEEFQKAILIDRDKKPPVFLVNHAFELKHGGATIDWLVFGDNSSWTRTKMFKLGIRVLNWGAERVKEGITEPFPVRDRRMEASKKHHPPLSSDDIWRLEGIAKNGNRCKFLNQNNIHTVKDLLESYWKDEAKLREILGGISKKSRAWNIIICHAKECADLVDYNGALDQSIQVPKIPSISSALLTCNSTYLHGTSSSQQDPLENQIINEDAVASFSGQLPPFQGYNSGDLLDHAVYHNVVEHPLECDNEVQAQYTSLNNTTHPQQVSLDRQINTANSNMDQLFNCPVDDNTSWVSPLEVLQGRTLLQDQFCTSSEDLVMLERSVTLQTHGGPCIVGTGSSVPNSCENVLINTDTSVLNVGPMIHTIAGELQVEIPMDSDPMEDLLANFESTPSNSSHFLSRGNSFDAGSCEALVQGFIASMTPRRSKEALLRSIRFLGILRKRTRTVAPGNQTTVLGC